MPLKDGEKARRLLSSSGTLDTGYMIVRRGNRLLIPVKEASPISLEPGWLVEECSPPPRPRRAGSVREALKEILGELPPDIVTSYVIVGDIAIVSMPRELAEKYGKALGRAIASIHRRIKAVYAKTGTRGELRLPALVHLYGERITKTVYKEYGLLFPLDISKVYVNPGLANEHRRVAENVREGEMVLDMFTGYGGFPIHIAALKRAIVVAQDLNPYAVKYARGAAESNRLKGLVEIIHGDSAAADRQYRYCFDRIIMNLPLASDKFVSHACTIIREGGVIHYYTLASSLDEAVRWTIEVFRKSGCLVSVIAGRKVIDYAPYKYIYSIDLAVKRKVTSTRCRRDP